MTSLRSFLIFLLVFGVSLCDDAIFEKKMIRDLSLGYRRIAAVGCLRSHFLLVASQLSMPGSVSVYNFDDYYLYDLPSSTVTDSSSANPRIYLNNVLKFMERLPAFTPKMSDAFTVLLAISDSTDDYLLVAHSDAAYAYNLASDTVLNLQLPNLSSIRAQSNFPSIPLLSSADPLSFYVLSQVLTDSYFATDASASQSRYRLTEWLLIGSTTLAGVNQAIHGKDYRICKWDEAHIVTRSAGECSDNVGWNLAGGFVDRSTVYLWDSGRGYVYTFPKSALSPKGEGRPIRFTQGRKGHVFIYGKRPASPGTVVAIVAGVFAGLFLLLQKSVGLYLFLKKRKTAQGGQQQGAQQGAPAVGLPNPNAPTPNNTAPSFPLSLLSLGPWASNVKDQSGLSMQSKVQHVPTMAPQPKLGPKTLVQSGSSRQSKGKRALSKSTSSKSKRRKRKQKKESQSRSSPSCKKERKSKSRKSTSSKGKRKPRPQAQAQAQPYSPKPSTSSKRMKRPRTNSISKTMQPAFKKSESRAKKAKYVSTDMSIISVEMHIGQEV